MTFGIVTFLRPDKLRRLVESIRKFHGNVRIMIADNGRKLPARAGELAEEIAGTETHVLPFDCGLSECRNFLILNANDDVLILDDDYEFTEGSQVQWLQDVLDCDPEVGVVGGCAGTMQPQLLNRKIGRIEWKATPQGTRYCICEITDNFLLVRKEAAGDLCWNSGLKVGEHRDFFLRAQKSKWKVACVPDCTVKHVQGGSEEYVQHRSRAQRFAVKMRVPSPPSIVVVGVGHSGTSVVTRILEQLGWNLGDVKDGVAEHKGIQEINKRILARQGICPCGSDDVSFNGQRIQCRRCSKTYQVLPAVEDSEFWEQLQQLPTPWAIKDPRMVLTLDRWMAELSRFRPFLLHVERDIERMKRTYKRHRFDDFRIYGRHIGELQELAKYHYANWPTAQKLSVRYEQIAEAVKLFDLGRVA